MAVLDKNISGPAVSDKIRSGSAWLEYTQQYTEGKKRQTLCDKVKLIQHNAAPSGPHSETMRRWMEYYVSSLKEAHAC